MNTLEQLSNKIILNGSISCRRELKVIELFGVSVEIIEIDEIKKIIKSEELYKEYEVYRDMSFVCLNNFNDILKKDKYSRRLIIQFPFDYHYKLGEDMAPCIESFCVFYISEDKYILTINFRSSEIKRLLNDLRIIYTICIDVLQIKNVLNKIYVNFFNIHQYIQ
jgi:hypothetical protein